MSLLTKIAIDVALRGVAVSPIGKSIQRKEKEKEDKEKEKIRKIIKSLPANRPHLTVLLDSELMRSSMRYYWTSYKFTAYSKHERPVYKIEIDKDVVSVQEIYGDNRVRIERKKSKRSQDKYFYTILYPDKTTLEVERMVKNKFSMKKKQNEFFEYRFSKNNWIIKETVSTLRNDDKKVYIYDANNKPIVYCEHYKNNMFVSYDENLKMIDVLPAILIHQSDLSQLTTRGES